MALFSSKGYAIGENFAQWLAHKLSTTEQLAGELIGHVEVCSSPHHTAPHRTRDRWVVCNLLPF